MLIKHFLLVFAAAFEGLKNSDSFVLPFVFAGGSYFKVHHLAKVIATLFLSLNGDFENLHSGWQNEKNIR